MMRPIRKMARIPAPIPLGPDSPFKDGNVDKAYREIYDNHQYWPCFTDDGKAPVMPTGLRINTMATVGGSVAVQYASDNTLGKAGKE